MRFILKFVSIALTAVLVPAVVQAATCYVTNNLDSGPGSLRAQLGDTSCQGIEFDNDYTIRLASPLNVVSKVINRYGGRHIVISGDTYGDGQGDVQLMLVHGPENYFYNLTLTTGYCGETCLPPPNDPCIGEAWSSDGTCRQPSFGGPGDGGAIRMLSNAEVSIYDCTFSDNTAAGSGGAIYMGTAAGITVQRSSFINNRALNGRGGAIGGGHSSIQRIFQGGWYADSRFIGNSAHLEGGAIFQVVQAINGSTFWNNSAGGDGGAVWGSWGASDRGGFGGWAVANSTFYGNTSESQGGAIYAAFMLYLTNSTVSGNSASVGGAGIRAGAYTSASDQTTWWYSTARNSIIANNHGDGNCPIPVAWSSDSTNNLSDDDSCGTPFTNSPVLLGPIGNYGGLTETMPLLPGSAALHAGHAATCAVGVAWGANGLPIPGPAGYDQRGVARPQGTACDVGAFESRGFALSAIGGTPQSAVIGTTFAGPLQVALSEAGGSLLPGGTITFSGPTSGAGINPATLTATTDENGQASVSVAANGTAGAFAVTADAGGATAGFALENLKATPTVMTWPTASGIAYGQALSSSTLTGGTASVPGTFAWTVPATVPGAGAQSASVTFTPTDLANYNTVGGTVTVTVNPYVALVQAPINAYGSSVFNARRGVVPAKFALTLAGQPTCALPPATISVARFSADGTATPVNESEFLQAADTGTNFRVDQATCQYVYNLAARSLGAGKYLVTITLGSTQTGAATFSLK